MASVRIPNRWDIREEEEFVEATTPDRVFHVLVLAPEGRKIGESIGEAVRYIRRNGTITVKPNSMKRETSKFKGRDMPIISWDAYENNQPIAMRAYVLPLTERESLLLVVWGSIAAEKKHQPELNNLLASIEPS